MGGSLLAAQLSSEEIPRSMIDNAVVVESYGEEHLHKGLCNLLGISTANKTVGGLYPTAYSGESGNNTVSYQQM